MSIVTNAASRVSTQHELNKETNDTPDVVEIKLESQLNIRDLESLQDAFSLSGDGYGNKLSLNKEQFSEALYLILNKGNKYEYEELFDKIDVTRDGLVDWDKLASHLLLEFYERDDRVKATQLPSWKSLKHLASPHKEIIQRIVFLKNTNRYLAISKEGCISMWDQQIRLQRTLRISTDSCKSRDLWVTNFTVLGNINKIALGFTSKEIAIYDLSSKLEFNCQFKLKGLVSTPLSLEYWFNPSDTNEAILTWGDTVGVVNALHFHTSTISLFERPTTTSNDKQDTCQIIQLKDVIKERYKSTRYTKHKGHTDWVRQVKYSAQLECFISCATTCQDSMIVGWLEKHTNSNKDMKTENTKILVKNVLKQTHFQISQGVNAFDYDEQLNLIATAGVNQHVCLWNPYVVSKPNGVLRGHMTSVIQVTFNKSRSQLISFSKDKVLRIWDVQLQVCIQRLAGMFTKNPEVTTIIYFDERSNRLFLTFNYQLTLLEMKKEIKHRVLSHEKPIVNAIYNPVLNQVISVCESGTINIWLCTSGQKVKSFEHGGVEVTCLAQDVSENRLFTGSADGTIKMWDFNGHCYHVLHCTNDSDLADICQVLILKRSILAVGWSKTITVFRSKYFKELNIFASDWKGGQVHHDDIQTMTFHPPTTLITASYDGEIIAWNNNSEQASKRLTHRCRTQTSSSSSVGTTKKMSAKESRKLSSTGSADEAVHEYGYAVSKLFPIEQVKGHANLASCGGNGWVRFWNTSQQSLVAEFIAHHQVGSIIMAIDSTSHWLVTGDVDGVLKTWNILDYLDDYDGTLITSPPTSICQFQPHFDMINSLEIFERNQRVLILSSSSDCSVALWDIYGIQIGVFGQEEHWKISAQVVTNDEEEVCEETEVQIESENEQEEKDEFLVNCTQTYDPNYRHNSWSHTVLGKSYQEMKVKKRERRQPMIIENLPYLHWERTGQAPAGPYGALNTCNLGEVEKVNKPDFMNHLANDKNDSNLGSGGRQEAFSESLDAAFDEKTLFPKYLLDYEIKIRQYHAKAKPSNKRNVKLGATSHWQSFTGPSKPK